MKIHNMPQGTDEWFEIRKLKLTASNATCIATNGAGLTTYINKIILESITPQKRWSGEDTERGHTLEPFARAKYEFENNVEVVEIGFVEFSQYVGYSPDGFVGEEGLIECKARNDEKHLTLLIGGEVDSATIWQMNMGMLCTNRKWCDFISYNPNFKNSFFCKRFYRDEDKIQKLRKGLYDGTNLLKQKLANKIITEEINHKNQ